jgi:ligand-binding sensor domain-containing protein
VAPDEKLWFDDSLPRKNRIARFDGHLLEHLDRAESAIDNQVAAIHTTPEGIMWLGDGNGGVTRFDPVRFTFTRPGGGKDAPSSEVAKIRPGPDGALWFATMGGVYRYEEESFLNYTKADGLPNDEAFRSAVMANGTVWLSGAGTYLARVKPGVVPSGESRFVEARTEGLERTGVFGLLADKKGGLWVGGLPSLGGVYYYSPDAVARGEKPFRSPTNIGTLNSAYAFAFHIDSDKTLWIGSINGGLHKFKLDDLWAGKETGETIKGFANRVFGFYWDSHGAIWTAPGNPWQPISRINGNEIQTFSTETTGGVLPNGTGFCFQEGTDGLLYIGTETGLARYNGTNFVGLEGTADRPVPRGNVIQILRDHNDVLWFASDSGVFRYDGVTWTLLDEEDGLPSLDGRRKANCLSCGIMRRS